MCAVSDEVFVLSEIVDSSVSGDEEKAGVTFLVGKCGELDSKLKPAQLRALVDELLEDMLGEDSDED